MEIFKKKKTRCFDQFPLLQRRLFRLAARSCKAVVV